MPSRANLSDEFLTKTVTLRGVDYKLRELSEEEFDAESTKATTDGRMDNVLLLKLMLIKALVEPRLNAEQLAKKPYRVISELRATVNRMHWGDDEFEEVDDEEGKDESSDQ